MVSDDGQAIGGGGFCMTQGKEAQIRHRLSLPFRAHTSRMWLEQLPLQEREYQLQTSLWLEYSGTWDWGEPIKASSDRTAQWEPQSRWRLAGLEHPARHPRARLIVGLGLQWGG